MEIDGDDAAFLSRKRSAKDVWETGELQRSLVVAALDTKRTRVSVYHVWVRTLSGTRIRVEPLAEDAITDVIRVRDVKRALEEDHGVCVDDCVSLMLDKKNVSGSDALVVPNGSTLYVLVQLGGCKPVKSGYVDRAGWT